MNTLRPFPTTAPRQALWYFTMLVALTAVACSPTPRRSIDTLNQDTARARQLTEHAMSMRDTDQEAAIDALLEALRFDPYYAPAHNNLGALYYNTGRLNAARDAFQSARQLLPDDPAPRLNLALVYSTAGLSSDAESLYQQVLARHPNNPDALHGLLVLRTDRGARDNETRQLLEQLTLSDNPEWSAWARDRLRAFRSVPAKLPSIPEES